ncbi:hypothetical protein [Streptomyces virginiae]|uniref:hypothetical protein n=1 Tax=Streptomyces virginiae TaxID=1961 RepID=UPI00224FDE90|nr:hypothetical protein [Streptomyces virginiae]MCX4960868.1 hypothetical protein [Streptomyces virginiae]
MSAPPPCEAPHRTTRAHPTRSERDGLADTDQGARIYLAPEVHGFPDGVVVQGPDGDWAGHPMTFAEWLHRYLSGEEMAGWGSAAHYPGPVLLEYPASEPGQPPREVYGPERGM